MLARRTRSVVRHPAAGDVPGATLYGFRTGDYVVHAWDLARATDGDEVLSVDLVTWVWAVAATGRIDHRAVRVFGRAEWDGARRRPAAASPPRPHGAPTLTLFTCLEPLHELAVMAEVLVADEAVEHVVSGVLPSRRV